MPADPISEQKPTTSSSVSRAVVPSSSLISTSHSRLTSPSSGVARLTATSDCQYAVPLNIASIA